MARDGRPASGMAAAGGGGLGDAAGVWGEGAEGAWVVAQRRRRRGAQRADGAVAEGARSERVDFRDPSAFPSGGYVALAEAKRLTLEASAGAAGGAESVDIEARAEGRYCPFQNRDDQDSPYAEGGSVYDYFSIVLESMYPGSEARADTPPEIKRLFGKGLSPVDVVKVLDHILQCYDVSSDTALKELHTAFLAFGDSSASGAVGSDGLGVAGSKPVNIFVCWAWIIDKIRTSKGPSAISQDDKDKMEWLRKLLVQADKELADATDAVLQRAACDDLVTMVRQENFVRRVQQTVSSVVSSTPKRDTGASMGTEILARVAELFGLESSASVPPFLLAATATTVSIAALSTLYYQAKARRDEASAQALSDATKWMLQDFEKATLQTPFGLSGLVGLYSRVLAALGLESTTMVVDRLSELRSTQRSWGALAKIVARDAVPDADPRFKGPGAVAAARERTAAAMLARLRSSMRGGDMVALKAQVAQLMQPMERSRAQLAASGVQPASSAILAMFRRPLGWAAPFSASLRLPRRTA